MCLFKVYLWKTNLNNLRNAYTLCVCVCVYTHLEKDTPVAALLIWNLDLCLDCSPHSHPPSLSGSIRVFSSPLSQVSPWALSQEDSVLWRCWVFNSVLCQLRAELSKSQGLHEIGDKVYFTAQLSALTHRDLAENTVDNYQLLIWTHLLWWCL